MTFDEWWTTKDIDKSEITGSLKKALKELAYEAWCESRYHQNLTKEYHCHVCGVKEGELHQDFCSVGNGIYRR